MWGCRTEEEGNNRITDLTEGDTVENMPKRKAKKQRLQEESERQETPNYRSTHTEVVVSESLWSPEFIQDLLPSAERTALLYHLSFLCLGGFPKLERLIRQRAIDTQMLFGSSEALLLKCVGTSSNMVTTLFPILKAAVQKNKPQLAKKYLDKARTWIDGIVTAVDKIVTRFETQNNSVGECTSYVYNEQTETKEKLVRKSDEIRSYDDELVKLNLELEKHAKEMKEIEEDIDKQNQELQDHIRNSEQKKKRYGFFRAIVPFFKVIHDAITDPGIAAKTESINANISNLNSKKRNLQNEQWKIKVHQTDLQLKLATSRIKMGEIPSPDHLTEVQQCLSRIQSILVSLKKFWENVGAMLETLKDNTFAGEDLIDELDDMKDYLLSNIEEAGKYWKRFGACCYRAQSIFSIQSKDAYKFLEVNPSSLSEAERIAQYESIMERLKNINPQGSSSAAITE